MIWGAEPLLPEEIRRLWLVQLGEKEAGGGGGFLPVNLLGRVETWEDICLFVVRINSFDLMKLWSCNSCWQREESCCHRSENLEQPLGAVVEDEGFQIKLMNEVMLHSCPQQPEISLLSG